MRLHGELARLRKLWRPRIISKYLANNDEPAIHIGCGARNIPGWLNVDKFAANADTYLNAYERFPFKDNTFSLVFTEHMIEHLEINKVKHFLEEVCRILKPGGTCRITCPDLELYANRYVGKDTDYFSKVMGGIEHKRRKRPDLTWVVRTNGSAFITAVVKNFHKHRWMYDFETLESCLAEIGFRNIMKKSFGNSKVQRLAEMDNPERSFESLYLDAVK